MGVVDGAEVKVMVGVRIVAVDEGGGLKGSGAVGFCRR